MSNSVAGILGEIAGKITTLEIAFSRCRRHHGRLSVAKLVRQHDAEAKPQTRRSHHEFISR